MENLGLHSKNGSIADLKALSLEHSKERTSPVIESQIRDADPANGGVLTSGNPRRSRRSYSMVSSLDKLTRKLKNNLLDIERNNRKDSSTMNSFNLTNIKNEVLN